MPPTRVGIIGLGSMGLQHAAYLAAGTIHNATLTALCTRNPTRDAPLQQQFPAIAIFSDRQKFFTSKMFDALLIATPHYDHPRTIREGFAQNLHVLVEKPLAVSLEPAQEIVAEYAAYPHLKFGIMYNQRTNPLYQKIRELIQNNALGKISRITWIITNWFRTNAYYNSSPWCATWKGEGGGVLINQSIHNLDLLHWLTGLMPSQITAVASVGKHHPIEVEDDLSAILEYPHGATTHFITTTGEYPGANRLEMAGTHGQLLCENNTLTFTQNSTPSDEFLRTSLLPFAHPETTQTHFSFPTNPLSEHQRLTQNFIEAIQNNTPNPDLLAPAPEGLHAVELANALLLAGLTCTTVNLPLNPDTYEKFLTSLIREPPIRCP